MAFEIIEACNRLGLFPGRGRPGLEPGTRELTTGRPYVIAYRTRTEVIEVVRIWHGRQNR